MKESWLGEFKVSLQVTQPGNGDPLIRPYSVPEQTHPPRSPSWLLWGQQCPVFTWAACSEGGCPGPTPEAPAEWTWAGPGNLHFYKFPGNRVVGGSRSYTKAPDVALDSSFLLTSYIKAVCKYCQLGLLKRFQNLTPGCHHSGLISDRWGAWVA